MVEQKQLTHPNKKIFCYRFNSQHHFLLHDDCQRYWNIHSN
jgi:hypothetical protein